MADFDGNGKIDIAIANTFDMRQALAIFAVPYALNEKNQLLYNQDGTHFKDVSDSSGFTNIDVPDRPAGLLLARSPRSRGRSRPSTTTRTATRTSSSTTTRPRTR